MFKSSMEKKTKIKMAAKKKNHWVVFFKWPPSSPPQNTIKVRRLRIWRGFWKSRWWREELRMDKKRSSSREKVKQLVHQSHLRKLKCLWLIMVIGPSGIQFGQYSYEWLTNRISAKRESDLFITSMITDTYSFSIRYVWQWYWRRS